MFHFPSRPDYFKIFLLVLLVYSTPAASLAAGVSLHSVEVGKTSFDETMSVKSSEYPLILRGSAEYRWKKFLPVYAGVLYQFPEDWEKPVLSDTAKALEFEYYYSISGSDLARAADKYLQKNLSELSYQRIRLQADRLNAAYRDVKAGDRYQLTYIPGQGTTLRLNGKQLVQIAGADFQAAYFSIWLGDEPLSHRFKKKLLSNRDHNHREGEADE